MRALLVLMTVTLLAAGCSTPAGQDVSSGEGTHIRSCGREEVFDHPPQRIVSLNQHATEILVALGLSDRIVGTAYPDDNAPPQELAQEYNDIPLLSQDYPSMERILETEPDLVVGGFSTAFDDTEGRDRDSFEELGIPTMLLSESCAEEPVSMDTLLSDIDKFGKAMDVRDAAERVSTDIKRRVRAVEQRVANEDPVDVFVYDSGEQAPKTLGGEDLGTDALRRAGGRNVFADFGGTFPDVSWEQVAARKPESIVLISYLGSPAEGKRAYLSGHPLVSGTPAVRGNRFSTIPLVDLSESIRFPDAVEKLADELHGAS